MKPSEWLNRYWVEKGGAIKPYELGRIAVGLEIETARRLYLTVLSLTGGVYSQGSDIASALEQLLKDSLLWEQVQEWYERLLKYRADCALKVERI